MHKRRRAPFFEEDQKHLENIDGDKHQSASTVLRDIAIPSTNDTERSYVNSSVASALKELDRFVKGRCIEHVLELEEGQIEPDFTHNEACSALKDCPRSLHEEDATRRRAAVAVRVWRCETTDDFDDLRRGCMALDQSPSLHGRSFLVPGVETAGRSLCSLEAAALEIFTWHTRGMILDRMLSGAEWWVQVRTVLAVRGHYFIC